jgi:glycosyltransferase involved in cell wall biosynthesis
MRIGFDVTPLSVPQSGVGTYTVNLLAHLAGWTEDELIPLAHRPVSWEAALGPWARQNGNIPKGICGPSWPFRVNKTWWMQVILPWQLAGLCVDVCHFTNGVAPWWSPCPTVVTIHDMTLWLFPEHHYRRRLVAMRPFVPLAARRASAVIAVSQSTKQDVVRILRVPAAKVHVIYEAPAPCFHPLPPGPALEAVRQRYRLPEHFVLYVGTIEPRKNLPRLLEAFARLRKEGLTSYGMIFVGQHGWKAAPVYAAVERLGLAGVVRFLGYVPIEDLVALYNLAEVLAFPSLYEGFGLPVVEAMACGTPVVTSSSGALGEIAGDAAEFVEPTDVASIADGIRRVLTCPARRAELRERGLARAAQFTWTAAASQTRTLYLAAIQDC